MYRTVVTICTTSLTLNNSTFCPRNVFMCFVWISKQTAIISLYNINWLVCITETVSVYCAVRTGPTNCSTVCATPQFLSAEHALSQPSLCHTAVPLSRTRLLTAQSVPHRSFSQQNTPFHSPVCATPQFLSAEHALSQPSLCHHTCTVQLSTIPVDCCLYVGVALH